MKKLLMAGLFLLLLASSAWATANTKRTPGPNSEGYAITGDVDQAFPYGFVQWIYWKPSATGDTIVVRDVGSGGALLMGETAVTGDGKVQQVWGYCTPVLIRTGLTIGTGANYEVTVFYNK